MPDSTVTCLHCGHKNASHRVWCEKCAEPIQFRVQESSVANDAVIRERKQLYQRVLADLEALRRDGEVAEETYTAIRDLYGSQITQIDDQVAERRRADEARQLIAWARKKAHQGRFQEAIGFLQRGIAVDPDRHELEQSIAEIKARHEERERKLQASREAELLLTAANTSIAALQLEEAAEKLALAQRLDPDNKRVAAAIRRVNTQIAERNARQIAAAVEAEDGLVQETGQGAPCAPSTMPRHDPSAETDTNAPQLKPAATVGPRFEDDAEELPSPRHRIIEAASQWSAVVKPFLLDNVGWFVGAFLVVAGFIVLIVSFWGSIEQNRVLMHSLVYVSLAATTGTFFATAYFMRRRYPQLENSSDVLLVIVALLIPLVFAAGILTSLVPAAERVTSLNATAVIIGLCYGLLSAVLCYGVSMITSGLFARPFYRLYARVLIGICSVMLLAPGLRWLAMGDPQLAVFGLTLAQYAVMGVLGYGVVRFNRDFMKKVFLNRKTAAYFTFGTLANAAIVALAFLHAAVAGSPSWHQHDLGMVHAGSYGLLLVLLAAMLLHTDFYLKRSVGDLRRFSRFTFVGYAVSFLGLAVSMAPYLGDAFGELGIAVSNNLLLQNFFSAQTLLIAIVLYAWLVWRYESIPPLFLLLLAVIGEYHVLVTQWLVDAFGAASWGLASLPLFVAVVALDSYFATWDERKRKATAGPKPEAQQLGSPLRFAMPFRYVQVGLAVTLLGISLWTRSSNLPGTAASWLGITFAVYACFFVVTAILRRQPRLVYVAGLLAGLAALLGVEFAGGPLAVSLLGGLAAAWGVLAWFGERSGLKPPWRTVLADCCLLSAGVVTVIVLSRHVTGQHPYYFQAVSLFDAVALAFAAIAYLICARQYRSWLPVFGCLIVLAAIIPVWSAAIGLLATLAIAVIGRMAKQENAVVLEDRTLLFGTCKLPCEDVLPRLFVQPLSLGAIPLAVLGLLISASHVWQDNITVTVLLGAAASALALGLLTRTHRVGWLYCLSLLATYFTVHAAAHRMLFASWSTADAFSGHLAVAAVLTLLGWCLAQTYAAWCGAMIKRVATEKEGVYVARRAYYAGLVYDTVSIVGGLTLAAVTVMLFGGEGSPRLSLLTTSMTAILFALAAAVYRSQVGSYLSLAAITTATFSALRVVSFSQWEGSTVIAGLGLVAAAASWLAGRWTTGQSEKTDAWKEPWPLLPATDIRLWSQPLAVYAVLCSVTAIVATLQVYAVETSGENLAQLALKLAMASGACLLSTPALRTSVIYLTGIALAYAASLAVTALAMDQRELFDGPLMVYLLVSAGLSLAGCCGAILSSWAINRPLQSADQDRRVSLLANREFYAGLLHHFVLATSCLTLVVLASAVITDGIANAKVAWSIVWVSLPLAATFCLSGAIYHSRIQTYCALVTLCFGFHSAVTMLVPDIYRAIDQTLAVSMAALIFGVIAWLLMNRADWQASAETNGVSSWHACWTKPPLPLVSLDATRWGRPLAHVSVFLASLTLFLLGRDWFASGGLDGQPWLTALPIYFAAAAFFVASKTYRFGWLRILLGPASDGKEQGDQLAFIERGFFYVISLLVCGSAIHLTAQLLALESLPERLTLAWHLLLAACLVLLGWLTATIFTVRQHRQFALELLDDASDAHAVDKHDQSVAIDEAHDSRSIGAENSSRRRELELYGGLLQHTVAIAAVIVFAAACAFGLPPDVLSLPLFGSIALLILYFGVASVMYRSQVVAGLSLLAVGLGTVHLSAFATLAWPNSGVLLPPAIACLGVVSVAIASLLPARDASSNGDSERVFWLPSPWSRPFTWSADSKRAVWLRPLLTGSMLYAGVALTLLLLDPLRVWAWQPGATEILLTLYFVAVTFALAARLYETPSLIYLTAMIVAISTVPLLVVLGEPVTHLGIALSLLAMLFWMAGFIVERYCISAGEPDTEPSASLVTRIYEQPLIRCSAVLATIAIAHSLLVWKQQGWLAAQLPLVAACAIGAITLMLNARSLNVMHRVTRARTLVYLACASITGCVLSVMSMAAGFDGLGPGASVTALTLGIVGLLLIERGRALATVDSSRAEFRLTFGEPISQFANVLAIAAAITALIATIGSLGMPSESLWTLRFADGFDASQLLPLAVTLLISAAACFIAVRVHCLVSWLYAAVVFGSVGLCLLLASETSWSLGTLGVATMVVMNLLVVVARIVRAHRRRIGSILRLSESSCERPFLDVPVVVAAGLLVLQGGLLAYALTGGETGVIEWPWGWVNLLAGSLFFHSLFLQPSAVAAHLLVASSIVGVLGVCELPAGVPTADVALAIIGLGWGIVAGLLNLAGGKHGLAAIGLRLNTSSRVQGERLLLNWSIALLALSVAIAIPIRFVIDPAYPNVSVTFLLATVAALVGGLRWRNVLAETISALLFPICLVSASIFYGRQDLLIQYGSLLAACLALIYFGVSRLINSRQAVGAVDRFQSGVRTSLTNVSQLFSWGVAMAAISSIFLGGASVLIGLSMVLVSVCWLWVAWDTEQETLAFSAIIGWFATVVYLSHTLFGVPFAANSLAAFFVIGYCFALYGINILVSRAEGERAKIWLRPSYYLAIALPMLLVVAIPFQQPTVAAFALLAAGSFYLVIAQRSQQRWGVYIAALLFNIAVYLWVPAARAWTGLYQLYVIPAAITVLIFAQLHRHELRSQVLTSIRLAASGAILAVSTFEVFFTSETSLLQFVAVLLLSIAGITAGIALRIKPFVYVGLAFLVINVIGQLGVRFHHEGGVVRAVILIGVGLLILAAMIFFNIHRERILRQYRGFLLDKTWE